MNKFDEEYIKKFQDGKHEIKICDLRPIGKKNTPMCIKCGMTGLRNLTNNPCLKVNHVSKSFSKM